MINFEEYNIKIKYFIIHAAGLNHENNNEPFIVTEDVWWPEADSNYETRMNTWNDLPNRIKKWMEKHKNQTIGIYYLSHSKIRYVIIKEN